MPQSPEQVYLSPAPLLIVLSGPSGVGKDAVLQALRAELPHVHYAVTATTRAARPGEVEGKSYYFLDQHGFDAMLDRAELIAPAEVHGHWYGAPIGPIRQAMETGSDVLLKIDVQGAIQVRRRFPQAVFIFLAPTSQEALVERLTARNTESPEELARRLEDARFEMAQMLHYDYIVVNIDERLEYAVHAVACIIHAERLRTHRQPIDWRQH